MHLKSESTAVVKAMQLLMTDNQGPTVRVSNSQSNVSQTSTTNQLICLAVRWTQLILVKSKYHISSIKHLY